MDVVEENDPRLVVAELLEQLPEVMDRQGMQAIMENYHPADIAEAITELPDEVQASLLQFMEPEEQGDLLEEISDVDAAEYVESMAPQQLADIIDSMPHDEAADLLETMSKSRAESILSLLPRADAADIRELLGYESDTAGGIMTNEFFHVEPEMTVREVRELLVREEREEENLGTIVVCREDMKFLGLVPAEELLSAADETFVKSLMERATVTVGPVADQEVCARYMSKYELPVLPVLDPRRRVIGIITFDDIMEVLDEEASEDMYRMAGVGAERPLDENTWARAFKRLPWFIVTICGMSLLGWIISGFEVTLERVVAVSFFIPAIMGLAGNVGIQASTITVRGLAMDDIEFSDIFWLLRRELLVGIILGVVCGSSLAVVSGFMAPDGDIVDAVDVSKGTLIVRSGESEKKYDLTNAEVLIEHAGGKHDVSALLGIIPRFPFTVGIAMLAGVIGSVLLGTCIPMICHRAGVDPALASGPFVTTLIDIGTQTLYLSLATWLLVGDI